MALLSPETHINVNSIEAKDNYTFYFSTSITQQNIDDKDKLMSGIKEDINKGVIEAKAKVRVDKERRKRLEATCKRFNNEHGHFGADLKSEMQAHAYAGSAYEKNICRLKPPKLGCS